MNYGKSYINQLKNHQMNYGKKCNFYVFEARVKIKKDSCLSLQDWQLLLNNFFCNMANKKVTVYTKKLHKGLITIENVFLCIKHFIFLFSTTLVKKTFF